MSGEPGVRSAVMSREVLRPLFDRVVVKELNPPETRSSGILVPPGAGQEHPLPQRGIIVACGEGEAWWAQAGVEFPVKVGDEIMFHWQTGAVVELSEERLLVMHVTQILGVVETAQDAAAA